jgi:hypothetical protein
MTLQKETLLSNLLRLSSSTATLAGSHNAQICLRQPWIYAGSHGTDADLNMTSTAPKSSLVHPGALSQLSTYGRS